MVTTDRVRWRLACFTCNWVKRSPYLFRSVDITVWGLKRHVRLQSYCYNNILYAQPQSFKSSVPIGLKSSERAHPLGLAAVCMLSHSLLYHIV